MSYQLPLCRLEQKRKELAAKKEELLKQSKLKATIMDNVKAQVELLTKVGTFSIMGWHPADTGFVKTANDVQKKVDELVKPISTAVAKSAE